MPGAQPPQPGEGQPVVAGQPVAAIPPQSQQGSVIDPGMPLVSGGAQPTVQPPPAVAPPAAPAPAQPAPAGGDADLGVRPNGDGTQSVPNGAFAKIKERERAKGKQEAQEQFDRDLSAHGFESMGDLLSTVKRLNTPATPGRPTMPATPKRPATPAPRRPVRPAAAAASSAATRRMSQRTRNRLEKERTAQNDAMVKMRTKVRTEERRRKIAERKFVDLKTENALREIAVKTGVQDLDYAVELIKREIRGKSDAELKEFKPTDFYTAMRETRPYLFGEVTVPATTGTITPPGAPPPTPKPGEAARAAAAAEQIDARKMNPEEFREHLRKRGLSPNGTMPVGA